MTGALRPLTEARPNPLWQTVNDPLLWGTLGVCIGVYLFFRGFILLRRKRLLLDMPISTVRAAALGPVQISGQAVGPYTLVAPLSACDCYYFRLVTTYLDKTVRTRSVEECTPLFVDDGTGVVMVDPAGAELRLPFQAALPPAAFPAYLRHFLAQRGVSTDDLVKIEEFCIRPQDKLVVLGTLRENPWSKPPAGGQPPLAHIGPGFLSAAEAEMQQRVMARTNTGLEIPVGWISSRQFDLYPPVILGGGTAPFVLSHSTPEELTGDLAFHSTLYIWAGPALALFSFYFLLQRVLGLWPR